MMDSTLAQLLNHIYQLEQENMQLKQFIQENAEKLSPDTLRPTEPQE